MSKVRVESKTKWHVVYHLVEFARAVESVSDGWLAVARGAGWGVGGNEVADALGEFGTSVGAVHALDGPDHGQRRNQLHLPERSRVWSNIGEPLGERLASYGASG